MYVRWECSVQVLVAVRVNDQWMLVPPDLSKLFVWTTLAFFTHIENLSFFDEYTAPARRSADVTDQLCSMNNLK